MPTMSVNQLTEAALQAVKGAMLPGCDYSRPPWWKDQKEVSATPELLKGFPSCCGAPLLDAQWLATYAAVLVKCRRCYRSLLLSPGVIMTAGLTLAAGAVAEPAKQRETRWTRGPGRRNRPTPSSAPGRAKAKPEPAPEKLAKPKSKPASAIDKNRFRNLEDE